jgi:hypothetical protein
MPATSNVRPSARAARFWQRLGSWYGHGLIAEQFGETPPRDWCSLIDAHSDQAVSSALSEIRKRHVRFPPKLPEVDEIFAKVSAPRSVSRTNIAERLVAHAIKNHAPTPQQMRAWAFFGRRIAVTSEGGQATYTSEIVGLTAPQDGDRSGFRVMIEDLPSEDQPHG